MPGTLEALLNNQTAGSRWWGGQQANVTGASASMPMQEPTSGYGSMGPRPPEQTAPTDGGAAAPSGGGQASAPQQDSPQIQALKATIQRWQQSIFQKQKQLVQYQGTSFGNDLSVMIQQEQMELAKAQAQLAAAQGG